MFCVQCEQSIQNSQTVGCTLARGTCGKTAEVSDLQDTLVHDLESVSVYAQAARKVGIVDPEIDEYVPQALFSTLTNVNFDPENIIEFSRRAEAYRDSLKSRYEAACKEQGKEPETFPASINYKLPPEKTVMLSDAMQFALNRQKEEVGEDVLGLRLLCLFGLKGAAAYMDHARVLGQTDPEVAGKFHDFMAYLAKDPTDLAELFQCAMDIGHLNFTVMQMLDKGLTDTFGHPEPTRCEHASRERQGHSGVRPRFSRSRTVTQANRRQGHQRLYAWRNAARQRLPGSEEIQESRRQLRWRLAKATDGIQGLPRRHSDDDQLPHQSRIWPIPGSHLHAQRRRLAGRHPYRRR